MQKATTISIVAKCSDLCFTELKDKNGRVIASHNGYVPDFMPGEHYGDYIQLEIDIVSGRLLNWKVPTAKDLAKPTSNSEWEVPAEE